jgi:hypothetical protein
MNEPEDLDPEKLMDELLLPKSYTTYEDEEQSRPEGLLFHGEEAIFPMFDELDTLILLHRDAHFSGSFSAMMEYYRNPDAKGILEEIELGRIAFLDNVEKKLKKNLASLLISGSDAERVAASRKAYQQLREAASKDDGAARIADAILSEESIEELVEKAPKELLQNPEFLLRFATSETFADPLFPGYGKVPLLMIHLLGKIRYEPAVPSLFSLIGRSDFDIETAALSALRQIGETAKAFALKKLPSRPLSIDNERAALVLLEFLPDENISKLFQQQLDKGVGDEADRLREYLLLGIN